MRRDPNPDVDLQHRMNYAHAPRPPATPVPLPGEPVPVAALVAYILAGC